MTKMIDLTGMRFGKLTVVSRVESHISKNGNKRIVWHCKCDCGNETDALALNLTRQHTTSCGCARKEGRDKLAKDIEGIRFGHLIGIHRIEDSSRTKWLFRCDCGNEVEAYLSNVVTGKTRSCGRKCGLICHPYENKKKKGYRGDLTGKRFGRLIVVKRLPDRDGWVEYLCKCVYINSTSCIRKQKAWQL